MATLPHLDPALWLERNSASRAVTVAFCQAWQGQHPDCALIDGDLNADPVLYLDALTAFGGFTDPSDDTPEQAAACAEQSAVKGTLVYIVASRDGSYAPVPRVSPPSTFRANWRRSSRRCLAWRPTSSPPSSRRHTQPGHGRADPAGRGVQGRGHRGRDQQGQGSGPQGFLTPATSRTIIWITLRTRGSLSDATIACCHRVSAHVEASR